MDLKRVLNLAGSNALFWISRGVDYPLHAPDCVQLNFTFHCNLRCQMCTMEEQRNKLQNFGKQTEIDSDALRKVIREAKEMGIPNVLFIGGEPLLRPDLFDLVHYARSLNLNPVIVTNGTLLDRDRAIQCVEKGVACLSMSLDAASAPTLHKIRGENIFSKIIENIRVLNEVKKEMKVSFPEVIVVCTIMNDNLEELPDLVSLCQKIKISRILFQPVVPNNVDQTERRPFYPGCVPEERWPLLDRSIDRILAVKKSSLENFSFIGNSISHLKLIKRYFRNAVRPREVPCYAGYNRLQIVQEGKVYFCVNQKKYEAAFGDIARQGLKDIWFSKKAKACRTLIRKCQTPCLQLCSFRDGFVALEEAFQKMFYFGKIRKGNRHEP
jgi:radical SAM protein with 4Fe4S-binding SPASM domain